MRLRFSAFLALVFILLFLAKPVDAATSEYLNYTEDYVDNNTSTMDAVEYGTHSNFENEKASDSTYDTLTEENTGSSGSDTEDFVDQLSTLHTATPDVGTHTDWTEMQDEDDTYNTMTEADTGSGGIDEDLYVNGFDSTDTAWTETGASPYLDVQDQPTNIIETTTDLAEEGYFTFPATSATSGSVTVTLYIYCNNDDGAGNDRASVFYDIGAGEVDSGVDVADQTTYDWDTVSLGSMTYTEFNSLKIMFRLQKVTQPDDVRIDAMYANVVQAGGSVYDMDLELGWTSAPYTETNVELCIDTGTLGSESLRVDIWDEVTTNDWHNLDTAMSGSTFENYSISAYINSGTVEIRFTDTSDDAVGADTYQIDCVLIHGWTVATTNYELDLEVQLTSITATQYGATVEYLCIETGTLGSEDSESVGVYIWDGSWVELDATLTASDWNNYSISSYLDATTETIRFLAQTESSDTTQSTFQIDAVLIRTHSYAYTESLEEIIDLQETNTRAASFSKVNYEVIDIYATEYSTASITVTLYEVIEFFDSCYQSTSFVIQLFEEVGIFKTLTLSSSFVIQLFEVLGIAVSISASKVVQLVLNEVIELYTTFYSASSFVLSLKEVVGLYETLSTASVFSITLFESLDIFESFTGNKVVQLLLYEQIDLFDSYSLSSSFSLVLNEVIDIYETLTTSSAFAITLYESIGIFESINVSRVIQIILYEQINISHSTYTSVTFGIVLSEVIDIFESISTSVTYSITLSEVIDIYGTAFPQTLGGVIELNLYEVIDISEAIHNSIIYGIFLSEVIDISESISMSIGYMIVLCETINLHYSFDTVFTGLWYLTFEESIGIYHDDTWAPYRPIPEVTTTTIDPNEIPWHPGSSQMKFVYNLLPFICIAIAFVGAYYISGIKPKKMKAKADIKVQGVKTRMASGKRTVERLTSGMPIIGKSDKSTREETVKKRKKKGKTLTRKVKRKVPKK